MPNIFAYIVLFTWPLVVVMLFKALPLRSALVWSIVAGYLLLPLRTGFDLPLLPAVEKDLILAGSAAIMCFWAARKQNRPSAGNSPGFTNPDTVSTLEVRRGQLLFLGLLLVLFSTPFITALQNGAPIIAGDRYVPGLKLYDAFSMGLTLFVAIIPFLLGRRYLASEDSQRIILRVLVLAALAYSCLILYEVRMSPQLNRIFYGFFPHSWSQHVRGNSFRPLVFLPHGLILAIFVAAAFLSSFVLWRLGKGSPSRSGWAIVAFILLGILVLCQSLGALALGLIFCVPILLLGWRTQLLLAAALAVIVLIYPIMRGGGLIPVDHIHDLAASINQDRAGSLKFRLDNEDRLLARAQEKPIAGWGSWGRNRVHDETGKDISVTDGYWVIVIGSFGWFGYLAQFGMLTLPTILLGLKRRQFDLTLATSSLALILCVLLLDLIPNASIGPLTWLVSGSMMGRFQSASKRSESTAETQAQPQTASTLGSETDAAHKVLYRRPLGKHRTTRQK